MIPVIGKYGIPGGLRGIQSDKLTGLPAQLGHAKRIELEVGEFGIRRYGAFEFGIVDKVRSRGVNGGDIKMAESNAVLSGSRHLLRAALKVIKGASSNDPYFAADIEIFLVSGFLFSANILFQSLGIVCIEDYDQAVIIQVRHRHR